jgi:hypothetical protein
MSASRTNIAPGSASVYSAIVWIGSAPGSQFRSRTAWTSRMAASPRLTMAIRENGTRLEDSGAVVT